MSKTMKRILTLAVALIMLAGYMPKITLPARAADVDHMLDTGVEGLSAEWTDFEVGDDRWFLDDPYYDWKSEAGIIAGTLSDGVTDWTECGKTTLILVNNKEQEAILSFRWEVSKIQYESYVSITYGGQTETLTGDSSGATSGTKEITLASNDTVVFELYVPVLIDYDQVTLKLMDLNLFVDAEVTTNFQPVSNGSYTVNGATVSADGLITSQGAADAYQLVATPAEGYVFSGWYSETDNTYLSTEANTSIKLTTNQTVYPKFIRAEDAVWGVGEANFENLQDAFYCAERSDNKVVSLLLEQYTLTESVEVPKGITLLIPFDADRTCVTTNPVLLEPVGEVLDAWVAPRAFRTLTLADGVTLTVCGNLSVAARHYGGQGFAGAPYGDCGFVLTGIGS